MKTVAKVIGGQIGVIRSNLIERLQERPKRRFGLLPLPNDNLVAAIKVVISELPTYGYRRVHAILKRRTVAGAPMASKRAVTTVKRSR